MNTENTEPEAAPEESNLHRFVQSVGLVVRNNAMNAWLSQADARQAVTDCFTILEEVIATVGDLRFKLIKDILTINDEIMDADNVLIEQFITCLLEHEISGFQMLKGITEEEFANLIEILSAQPWQLQELGGFNEFIKAVNCTHILPVKIKYQEISEEEKVVSKDEKAGGGKAAKAAKEPDKHAVESIVAFLKGQESTPSEELARQVKDVASDPEKMAELILQAAHVRQGSADLSQGETLSDIVVGCLRKTFDGLQKDPATKTKKGNKEASKTLLLLEEEMLDKLRGDPDGEECTEAVSTEMQNMQEKLRVDALASDYLKKNRAVESSEDAILKYMRCQGLGGPHTEYLQEQLTEDGGVLPSDWQKLVIKSGAPAEGKSIGDMTGGMGDVGQLAVLLTQLEQIVDKAHGKPDKEEGRSIRDTLAEVDSAIDGIVGQTQEHLDQFIHDVEVEGQPTEEDLKQHPDLPGHNSVEVLAEIVQEVCQPLSVIGCTLHMMRSHQMGKLDEEQTAMLNLATESTERVQTLIDNLRKISKPPESLTPDQDILNALYDIDTNPSEE